MEEMNELFLLMTDFIFKDCHLQNNHAFEFIGKVQQDLSVRVLASTDFGPEGNIGMISHCSLTLVLGPLISFFFFFFFFVIFSHPPTFLYRRRQSPGTFHNE